MSKINWVFQDESGTNLNRYKATNVATGEIVTFDLLRGGNISIVGTPLNASNMNSLINAINNNYEEIISMKTNISDISNQIVLLESNINNNSNEINTMKENINVLTSSASYKKVIFNPTIDTFIVFNKNLNFKKGYRYIIEVTTALTSGDIILPQSDSWNILGQIIIDVPKTSFEPANFSIQGSCVVKDINDIGPFLMYIQGTTGSNGTNLKFYYKSLSKNYNIEVTSYSQDFTIGRIWEEYVPII